MLSRRCQPRRWSAGAVAEAPDSGSYVRIHGDGPTRGGIVGHGRP